MSNCWEVRGCDDEMQQRCPHNTPGEPCPTECHFASCDRATRVIAEDLELILNPERDYDAAIKETCRICEHFLKNGPKTDPQTNKNVRTGNPNRFIL